MTVQIVLTCDSTGEYSVCSGTVYVTDAATVEQARSGADRAGWTHLSNGRDRCPRCSGRNLNYPNPSFLRYRP